MNAFLARHKKIIWVTWGACRSTAVPRSRQWAIVTGLTVGAWQTSNEYGPGDAVFTLLGRVTELYVTVLGADRRDDADPALERRLGIEA